MYATVGGTREHSLIKVNLLTALHIQFRGKEGEVYTTDILTTNPDHDAAFYPDLSAVCKKAVFSRNNAGDILLNPMLVVEVLSDSTERKDLLIKLPIYQAMPSIHEILYVRQDRVHITHHTRNGEDWPTRFYRTLTDEITLASIGCKLLVADVYERLSFETPAS